MLYTSEFAQNFNNNYTQMEQVLRPFQIKHYYVFNCYFAYLFTLFTVAHPLPTIASEQQPSQTHELEEIQTNITQTDIKIIEQLVTIAEKNASEVLDAKSATGWGAFQDVVSLELSPSFTNTNYNSPDEPQERESSFYLSISFDPIKLITTFQKKPVFQARLHEAKQQKRLAVIRYYLAYLQARQAVKIAAYRMQNFTSDERIASLNSQTNPPGSLKSLANADYVAAATEMLNSNVRKQVALEELAACVGLSTKATMTVMNRR